MPGPEWNAFIDQVAVYLAQPNPVFTTLTNDNLAGFAPGQAVSLTGITAAQQSQGVAGVGGSFAGYSWVGLAGPTSGLLVKDEAPALDRPDDFDLHSWESVARHRARSGGRKSES